jgi:hypothetical protein
MGGQHHATAALPQGKTRYPLYRRLGGPQGQSGRVRKISRKYVWEKLILTSVKYDVSTGKQKIKTKTFLIR